MKDAALGATQGWNKLGETERNQEGVESMTWLHQQLTKGASIGQLTEQMCTSVLTNFRMCYREVVLGETGATGSVGGSSGKILKDARRKTCMFVLKHFHMCSTRSNQVKKEEDLVEQKAAVPASGPASAPESDSSKEAESWPAPAPAPSDGSDAPAVASVPSGDIHRASHCACVSCTSTAGATLGFVPLPVHALAPALAPRP